MASNFISGFQTGQNFFNDRNKLALAAAAEARAQAEEDRKTQEFGMRMSDRAREDAAYSDMVGLRKNGVVTGNTSGISGESVQALNRSGGQALVDTTARLGNVEAAMLGDSAQPGMAPAYNVSGQAPMQYGPGGEAIGRGAIQGPTVQSRAANPRENLQAMYSLAAARRVGPEIFAALDSKARDLDKEDVYGRVGKMTDDEIRAKLPGLNAPEMAGLPIYDAGDVLDPKTNKPTGYRELKLVKNGKSEFIQVSPAQLRQIATAHALMESGFAQDGMAMLSGVSKDMSELVSKFNTSLKGVVDSGNTATNNRETAMNGRITANAAASNAATNAKLRDRQIKDLDDLDSRRKEAAELQGAFDSLDPKDPKYAENRRDIITRFNMLNVKNGGTISTSDGSGRGAGGGSSAALKYETDNLWGEAEKKLVGDNISPDDIATQKAQFYARRGFAPDMALQALAEGRDPVTGKKMTEADVAAFERTFPHTPIDRSKLSWLAPKAAKPVSEPGPAPVAGMRGASTTSAVAFPPDFDRGQIGGAVGSAIRAETVRGMGTVYVYQGKKYATRAEAEAARAGK